MTWLGFIEALAKFAGAFMQWLRDRQLMDAGRAEERADAAKARADAAAEAERIKADAAKTTMPGGDPGTPEDYRP